MPCKIIWWPLGTRSNVSNNTMSLSQASLKGLETNITWHVTDIAWMPLILSRKMQQKLPHWYANNCHWYTDTKTVKHACAVIECTGSTLYNATLTEMRILWASVLCILNEHLFCTQQTPHTQSYQHTIYMMPSTSTLNSNKGISQSDGKRIMDAFN